MSAGSTALVVIGILLILGGIGLIILDQIGRGDSHGIDLKDVGIVILGIILAAIGGALGRRRPVATAPA